MIIIWILPLSTVIERSGRGCQMSQLISSESACSETFTGEMVPYANQQQPTDFTAAWSNTKT